MKKENKAHNYIFRKGDWHDAEHACNGVFIAIEEYDGFLSLDFDVWMAKFRNGRLAAIVLTYPGIVLLAEEHPDVGDAMPALLDYINANEPIQMWYHPRGEEEVYAEQLLGLACSEYFEDTMYAQREMSEIDIHRLLKKYQLDT